MAELFCARRRNSLRLLHRDFAFDLDLVRGFDEGLGAATGPRLSGFGGCETTGELTEERGMGTRGWQRDANTRGPFDDARGDLDQV